MQEAVCMVPLPKNHVMFGSSMYVYSPSHRLFPCVSLFQATLHYAQLLMLKSSIHL